MTRPAVTCLECLAVAHDWIVGLHRHAGRTIDGVTHAMASLRRGEGTLACKRGVSEHGNWLPIVFVVEDLGALW